MSQIDPVFAAVTAPGTPFELVERDGLLQFAQAAPDLATFQKSLLTKAL